ncbi:hypothetical protein AURDEDRAFT_152551, partial [Auricularia subglabra TFB-10046 SS5]
MTESSPLSRLASHINACVTQELEAIYERCGPYFEESTHTNCQAACLADMGAFCRGPVDHLKLVRSQLRLRLSAASRINKLPADVLILIFASMPFEELVTATHVFHQWRKLGLETPALWADLALQGRLLKDAELLLERSKASLVDIRLTAGYHSSVPPDVTVLVLGPYMDRLRRLSIRPHGMTIINNWRQFASIPVELPAELRLQCLDIDWDV